jgi:hypothetical protein
MVDYPGTAPNKITYAQAEGLWIKAGGPKTVAPVAAAIAVAESGLDANQYNPTDNGGTQTSWGLWQVSHGDHSPYPNWQDPLANAQYAVAKYRGANGFTPWGTYDSGAYRAYLNPGTTPDPNPPGKGGGNAGAPAGGAGGVQTTASDDPACLVGTPNFDIFSSIPVIGGAFPKIQACLLSKSGARWMAGIGLMTASAIVGLSGAIVLAAYGLGRTPAGAAATGATGAVIKVATYPAQRAQADAKKRATAESERRAAEGKAAAQQQQAPGT